MIKIFDTALNLNMIIDQSLKPIYKELLALSVNWL